MLLMKEHTKCGFSFAGVCFLRPATWDLPWTRSTACYAMRATLGYRLLSMPPICTNFCKGFGWARGRRGLGL